jgi:hypothetical protein
MTNGILANEANLAPGELLTSRLIGKRVKPSSVSVAKTLRDKAIGSPRRTVDQALVPGLLHPKSSSLTLTALARAAAFSGKRLVLEIRDENPVRIIRTSTRGM